MTATQTQTAPAFVLANVSAETAERAAKGLGSACAKHFGAGKKAERDLISETVTAARIIGLPVTRAQLQKQFLADAKAEAMRAGKRNGIEKATVDNHFSRAQWIILATLLKPANHDAANGPHWSEHVAGESFRDFANRVALLLADATLPDGKTFILERGEDGKAKALPGRARGASVSTAAPASAGKTGDGNTPADPAKAKAEARANAAIVLMGNPKDGAALLALLDKHESDLRKLIAEKVKAA